MKISITNFWTQSPHFGLSGTAHAHILIWTQSLLTLRFCVSNATPAEGEVRALKSKQQFPRRKHTPLHRACKEEEPTLSTVWREGSPPQWHSPRAGMESFPVKFSVQVIISFATLQIFRRPSAPTLTLLMSRMPHQPHFLHSLKIQN